MEKYGVLSVFEVAKNKKRNAMKNLILSLFCLLVASSVNCYAMDVSGSLNGNVQWSGEIHIIGDVVIEPDAILTILPGTDIEFAANQNYAPWEPLKPYNENQSWLVVMGQLIAEGASSNWITFTSDADNPTPGDWGGILFHRCSGDSIIKYCIVEYGVDSINSSGDVSDSEIVIQNNIVRHSEDDGLLIGPSSDVNIQFNTIYNNGSCGVEFHKSLQGYSRNVILKNNIIVNNVYGIGNNSGKSCSSKHNNVWGNKNGDYNSWNGQINQNNDISSDPLFEDIYSDNVNLQPTSPCLTANECGGEIGAYGTCLNPIILEPPVLTVDINGTSVTLNWSDITNAAGYSLFYAPFPYQGPQTIGNIDMGAQTSVTANLWQGAAFYIAIQAYNSEVSSDYSNIELLVISDDVNFFSNLGVSVAINKCQLPFCPVSLAFSATSSPRIAALTTSAIRIFREMTHGHTKVSTRDKCIYSYNFI